MLEQTKEYGKFRGVVSGLQRKKGNAIEILSFGSKLTFFIKTSEFNSIPVQILAFNGAEDRDVFFGATEKGVDVKRVPFADRYSEIEGFKLLGINLKSHNDKEVVIRTDEDAIQHIMDNFKDGDTVFVETEITKSAYGEKVYTNHSVRKMYVSENALDFESEEFEEISEFKGKAIFKNCFFDKASKKGFITSYSIPYAKKGQDPTPIEFVYTINVKDKDDYAIYEYFEKNVKLGDVFEVEGIVHNRVIGHWVDGDDDAPLVGKKAKTFTSGGSFIKEDEQKEMEITAITAIEKGLYTEAELNGATVENLSSDDEKLPWE